MQAQSGGNPEGIVEDLREGRDSPYTRQIRNVVRQLLQMDWQLAGKAKENLVSQGIPPDVAGRVVEREVSTMLPQLMALEHQRRADKMWTWFSRSLWCLVAGFAVWYYGSHQRLVWVAGAGSFVFFGSGIAALLLLILAIASSRKAARLRCQA